ncbi:MAG: ImmA/IrrE family metallo-endopeptidase [Proteobacteria bacterium]|nr:ImmA/IrrE family metallo-endopeptidase [Pseudomonadota bacterium]
MRPAEKLLVNLGISDPRDIEVDAIARCENVEILYGPLKGCEAQIVGFRDRAVVYVDNTVRETRKRFSAGHELGHWHHHRGQSFVCRSEDIGKPIDERSKNAEKLADSYAADLILPPFMIQPLLDGFGDITLEHVFDVARQFSASLTATAIRIVRMTRQPIIVVAHNLYGKNWHWPSIGAGGLFVREDIDIRSSALSRALSQGRVGPSKKEPAGYWFDRRHVDQFDVRVQSCRTIEGEGLTILRVLDPKMIEIYG